MARVTTAAAAATPAVPGRSPARSLLPLAEVALGLVTLSVVFGLDRLFVDASPLARSGSLVGGHVVRRCAAGGARSACR